MYRKTIHTDFQRLSYKVDERLIPWVSWFMVSSVFSLRATQHSQTCSTCAKTNAHYRTCPTCSPYHTLLLSVWFWHSFIDLNAMRSYHEIWDAISQLS